MKDTKLTKQQVEHIAQLSNISLTEKQVEVFQQELSDTITYINELDTIDTTHTVPTYQVTNLKNVWREDVIKKSLSQKDALANGKKVKDGYFVTDIVLK